MPTNMEDETMTFRLEKIYIHPDTEEWKRQRLFQLPHNRSNFSCQQINVEDYTTTTSTFS